MRRHPWTSNIVRFVLTLAATLTFASLALGQTETATLSGTVLDSTGAVIPGVEVKATNSETTATVMAITNSAGVYVIPTLKPGRYRINVIKQGFKQIALTDLVLNVQDVVNRNFTLAVGATTESITVTAESEKVNTTSATVSTTVDRTFVENMPLNGRSFQSLIELTPGMVTAKTTTTNPGQFSVNGQRTDANYYTVDGVSGNIGVTAGADVTLGQTAGGSLPASSVTGGTSNLVSVDAMQEFKIQTSTFAPEFGRTPGAQISIVTRSGTNDWHGTAFEYLRNEVLDANDWLANHNGLPKPSEKQNDFGGVIGGPIIKDKTFFFFSYEGLRLRLPETRLDAVPSMSARQSAPAAIQPLLNSFPQPNRPDTGPYTSIFAAGFSNASTINATSIRIDHALTKRINIFGRYNDAPSSGTQRGAFDYYTTSTVGHLTLDTKTLTVGATVTASTNSVNEFRFNWSKSKGATIVTADNFGGAVPPPDSYLFQPYPQGNSKSNGFFVLLSPDIGGFYVGQDVTNFQRQWNVIDSVSLSRGSHQIKLGVDYRRLSPINNYAPYQLSYSFNGVAAALSLQASYVRPANGESGDLRLHYTELSLFAQDTWQVNPRLSLTYGLRWDYNPPPSESTGHPLYNVTNLSDPASVALAPAGTPLWHTRYSNFAPRAGIAYQLRNRPGAELTLRTGLGVFYDLGNANSASGAIGAPYRRRRKTKNIIFPGTTAEAAPSPFSVDPPYSGFLFAFDPDLVLPRSYQWNMALEQSLGSNQSLTLSYVGSASRKLLRQDSLASVSTLNPNFQAATIYATRNQGASDYHAMQAQFQRRLSHGLQALASYTWSHAIDNASNDSTPWPFLGIYNPKLDRGPSDFDIRHSFSAALTYNFSGAKFSGLGRKMLGGWAVQAIFKARAAVPINVLTGVDAWELGELDTIQRPNIVPGVPFYVSDNTAPGGRRINSAAFSVPPMFQQGDLGRNALQGFPAWQQDLAMHREFRLTERVKLQFRSEFFNVFNHPNFGDPGSQSTQTNMLANPQFGISTLSLARSMGSGGAEGGFSPLYQLGGPRSIQFAVKLMF